MGGGRDGAVNWPQVIGHSASSGRLRAGLLPYLLDAERGKSDAGEEDNFSRDSDISPFPWTLHCTFIPSVVCWCPVYPRWQIPSPPADD